MSLLNFPLKCRILIAISAYVLWVAGFAYYNYNHEKGRIYSQLDQQLESAALTASLLVPDKLHHQNMMANDISLSDDDHNISTLSNYTDHSDIVYIYTLILRNHKIFFTSSSATKKERESDKGLSHYFDEYDDVDPRIFDVFKSKQKTFLEYSDQWGSFRSVFMPRYSSDGTFYLAAADLSTSYIQALLNQQLYQTFAIALLFLVFAYPLYFVASHYIHQKSKDLERKLQQKSIELSTNQQRLERVLKASNQAWVEINVQTEDIIVSDDYYSLLNISDRTQKFSVQTWKDNLHPDDLDTTMMIFQHGIDSGESIAMVYRRQTADGRWLWLQTICKVTEWDQQHNPVLMIGTVMDISERKRSELVLQALAESDKGNILKTIVRQLALSHDMHYAFIAKINPEGTQATTQALWNHTQFVENVTYELVGTPCETVLNDTGIAFYADNIQHVFPDDQMLVSMEAKSYLGVALRDSNNNAIGLISVVDIHPMTENWHTTSLLKSLAVRASAELERKQSEEKLILFSHMFHNSHEGIILVDDNDLIIDVNPTFCTNTGYSTEEIIGKPAQIFRSQEHKYTADFYENIRQSIIRTGRWQGAVWNKMKNGEEKLASVTITQITDENNKTTHRFMLVNDITEKKKQQDALKFMAHYDALTKLPNRALFVDRFHQAAALSKRKNTLLAICFLDLDNFKPINDNFGHNVGDQILLEVARRISSNLREEDTVSRQGGDEFTLLLGSIESFSQCEKMLSRILQSVAEPYHNNNSTHTISASIGVTLYPLDDGDIDTLTRHADHAMYQAKQAGRNQYQLYDTLDDRQKSNQQQQLKELQRAIEYNQFCLHYQPKVNMKTGEVFGVEALIRWQHPKQGMLFPLDFLPAAENSNLEIEIGEWVIEKALSQMDKWFAQGIVIEVSVNISSYHLQSTAFITYLENSLAQHPNVDPQYLQLEILESSALGDLQTISSTVNKCQIDLGVSVALDDFGTGYSSLTHLRNLSAQTIKIDRSFVRDLLDDPSDFAIIDGVIGLAEAFNREVIAEGVETTNHGLMLLAMGCDEAQGYGISRPMPANDLPTWLAEYSPNQSWLNCGKKSHTEQQIKIKFIRLTTEKWFNTIKDIIQSPDTTKQTKTIPLCHLGVWIDQLKKDTLFSKQWLDDIHQLHDDLYEIGEHAIHSYIDGHFDDAVHTLKKVEQKFKQLLNHLDHYN